MPDLKGNVESPYFGVRRLGPYLGVIQIVDVGDACAYSTNGRSWRIRQQTSSGRFRWGVTVMRGEGMDQVSLVNAEHLLDALEKKPITPFPVRDHFECWLLNKATSKPLALLKTCYRKDEAQAITNPHWTAFAHSNAGFTSQTLASTVSESKGSGLLRSHSDIVEHQVNDLARPLAVAQWIQRCADGSGVGLGGLRVEQSQEGRKFAAVEFPELLISEEWDNEIEAGIARDYHHWQSP
ncbi:MAG: hypothetical protein V3V12_01630, partial [Gammaproteobacteria bacterium]